ncbi:hypothetical protein SAMN00790413_03791 [Deinococcus hopiensis KR-140]|uniref:Uncharacterized protein n=1 Tax=Deinococcus hopiensis KR-140 TaxID=695939 RepID=A0A1W1UZ28_9DEIO|nr:hypothetical protein SAMN00790413_03791 [Deinococcus hopiensis KR-140]
MTEYQPHNVEIGTFHFPDAAQGKRPLHATDAHRAVKDEI